jgi:hypothetical protein
MLNLRSASTGPRWLAAALLALGGCAATPEVETGFTAPLQFKNVAAAPTVRDSRAAFRGTFCSTLRAERIESLDDASCDRWLWRLRDEPIVESGAATPSLDPKRLEVILVTGAFSECVGERSRPFAAGADRLLASGARVRTVTVGGRSGTGHNARQIADSLLADPVEDGRLVILIGYSKGGLDILRFVVDYPELAAGIDAVVGVATPVFGTPLADLAAPAYRALVASLPSDKCPAGDGDVLASLQPDAAMRWLVANPLPEGIRYYSLAAFATHDRVARALAPTWKHLGGPAIRNDGQVVTADAIVPGSTLLGYANSDHWGIALTTEVEHPVLLARTDPVAYPLEQLLVAIVTFVADDLAP